MTAFGTAATKDSDFYKNSMFSLIKSIIGQFNVGEDAAHFGLFFYGNADITSIKKEVCWVFCCIAV